MIWSMIRAPFRHHEKKPLYKDEQLIYLPIRRWLWVMFWSIVLAVAGGLWAANALHTWKQGVPFGLAIFIALFVLFRIKE
jgi:hypothetical protein